MSGLLEWIIFLALSGITVVTAAGMLLTMSMYRAWLALMASFVALAGLFILLDADLLAAIQIMMNVGGMLVMVLFMVMIMMDPGGEMMWGMKRDMHMPGPGAFSMHMPQGKPPEEQPAEHQDLPTTHNMHMEHAGDGSINAAPVMSMKMDSSGNNGSDQDTHMSHDDMQMPAMTPRQHYHMMMDMAMSTSQLPWAIALGIASALLLVILFIKTPWPLSHVGPTQDATTMVGELLLSRYMIGFEGAAFLILAGIAGAVILGTREGKAAEQPALKPTETGETDEQVYTCPMHADVRQNQPGNCPKCGMTLMPTKEALAPGDTSRQGEHA